MLHVVTTPAMTIVKKMCVTPWPFHDARIPFQRRGVGCQPAAMQKSQVGNLPHENAVLKESGMMILEIPHIGACKALWRRR
jgi:hypothetical protein